MARNKKTKKKGNVITVDFSGVEDKDFSPPSEGKHILKLAAASVETSDNSGEDYVKWEFQVASGKEKGKKVWYNTSLQPQALFNLRSLLVAMGQEIPEDSSDIDLDDLIDTEVGAEIVHDTYNKKKKGEIVDFFPVDEVEDADEDEEEDEKPKKGKKSSKKSKKDEDEEEDDEEEEAPKKSKGKKDKKKSKKKSAYTTEQIKEMDDEEDLQTVIDDNELEVDLREFKTTRKKQSAVIEALEEAGLMEEDED